MRRRTVCEIRQVASMTELRLWARVHGTRIRWMGATTDGGEIWGATRGVATRVCVTPPDGRVHPIVWRSPFEGAPGR
ncbi:hypothetical protein [Nocardiopsis sp. FIRDI 009]|uniref:hypothetical protein n=1 Tax=Nocardiopsis sp. FIRDI 009 TaxID=714197 RepID=UPI000E21E221|nr:hypothetical protein [Nocardiopsis sp. FIRDI 009]